MTDFALARRNMVESQVRTNRVTDPALVAALSELPREAFVPIERRSVAYVDEDIRISADRYLMEPMVLARLLQAAHVRKGDVALAIGCGTGYDVAVLARLAQTAIGIESDAALASEATATLSELGIDNAVIVEGPLDRGYRTESSDVGVFQVILFGGAIADVPEAILAQLAEGGRLVAVRRRGRGMGEAILTIKQGGVLATRALFDAGTPYLPGFAAKPAFVF